MQNTLELRHNFYGFRKEGVEDVTSIDQLETVTGNTLQAIVYEAPKADGLKVVFAIMEVDLLSNKTTYDKGLRRLKTLSKKYNHVANTKVEVKASYGGNVRR